MALVKYVKGQRLSCRVEWTANTFSQPFSLNVNKSVTFENSFNEFPVSDRDDLDKLPTLVAEPTYKNVSISGSGTLDTDDLTNFLGWFEDGGMKDVTFGLRTANTVANWVEMPAYLESFSITGESQGLVEFNVSFKQAGDPTFS